MKTEAIDAFCWIHATYPLEPGLIEKLSNLPGTGPPHINRLCSSSQTPPPDTSFYQWVHVFLILQVEGWLWLEFQFWLVIMFKLVYY